DPARRAEERQGPSTRSASRPHASGDDHGRAGEATSLPNFGIRPAAAGSTDGERSRRSSAGSDVPAKAPGRRVEGLNQGQRTPPPSLPAVARSSYGGQASTSPWPSREAPVS